MVQHCCDSMQPELLAGAVETMLGSCSDHSLLLLKRDHCFYADVATSGGSTNAPILHGFDV